MFCGLLFGSIFSGLLYGIHIFAAFLMVVIILMQAAKGGGLSGAFGAGVGSSPLFGAGTSTVLVRTTAVLAVIFTITCISLAALQARKSPIPKEKKYTEDVGEKPTGKEEPAATAQEGAGEKKEESPLSPVEGGAEKVAPAEEKALSPVEAGGKVKEKGAAGTGKLAPPGEKALSPVEASGEAKKKGAAKSESPSPPEEKALSPVEAGGEAPSS